MEERILDVTCGARSIWFDHNNPDCVFVDNRVEHNTKIWQSKNTGKERFITVNPDVVSDFTDLPFPDNTFYLVVFDPPHLLKVGENAWLKKKYGKLPEDWPRLIHDGFWECMRVLKPNGTLVFKWNETDITVKEIIVAIGKEPLFGHKSGKQSKTHWLCFMKQEGAMDERLTIKRENGFMTVRNTTLQGLIDRLAKLEDKIESGELVEVPKGAVVLTPEERAEEMRLANEERKQAVKEFAEKLRDKEFSAKIGSEWVAVVKSLDIDELVTEVCGE